MVYANIIDESGFIIRNIVVEDYFEQTDNIIITPCPQGFYLPKWDGSEWVEGGNIPIPTIETINNQVREKIAERYDTEQELQMLNKALIDVNNAEYLAYKQYREECINWGIAEKQKYNLI